jgi:hypothetical protein
MDMGKIEKNVEEYFSRSTVLGFLYKTIGKYLFTLAGNSNLLADPNRRKLAIFGTMLSLALSILVIMWYWLCEFLFIYVGAKILLFLFDHYDRLDESIDETTTYKMKEIVEYLVIFVLVSILDYMKVFGFFPLIFHSLAIIIGLVTITDKNYRKKNCDLLMNILRPNYDKKNGDPEVHKLLRIFVEIFDRFNMNTLNIVQNLAWIYRKIMSMENMEEINDILEGNMNSSHNKDQNKEDKNKKQQFPKKRFVNTKLKTNVIYDSDDSCDSLDE